MWKIVGTIGCYFPLLFIGQYIYAIKRGGDVVNGGIEGIVILAHYKLDFIREHKIWCKIQVIINPFIDYCSNV